MSIDFTLYSYDGVFDKYCRRLRLQCTRNSIKKSKYDLIFELQTMWNAGVLINMLGNGTRNINYANGINVR